MAGIVYLASSVGLLTLGAAGFYILRRTLRLSIPKDNGAFIQYFELLPSIPRPSPSAPHPLSGLTFAVKDIFDVEGYVTGFGNPDWAATHERATNTAPVVKLLVEAGAKCIGKLHMDELAYSINGENKHYGTPVNPAAPDRIPGGSSSGSGVAVAAELVDFSLGSDTAGSVRVPAAYCGILGFRPSHGAIPVVGVIPMAQSFDTVGWFARDPRILRQVGRILLQLPYMDARQPRQFLIADDCFKLSLIPTEHTVGIVRRSVQKVFGGQVLQHINLGDFVAKRVPSLKDFGKSISNGSDMGTLTLLRNAMQLLQRWEFKQNHEKWLTNVKPNLAPALAARAKAAMETSPHLVPLVRRIRDEAHFAINDLLKNHVILVMPTVPDIPPKLNTKAEALEEFRNNAFNLICVSGMSGCCQVSIPAGEYKHVPVAVSLLAKHGSDRLLLDTVVALYATVQEESGMGVGPSSITRNDNGLVKEKGNNSFGHKDFKKAASNHTDAIWMNGNDPTYHNKRPTATLKLSRFQKAEVGVMKALGMNKQGSQKAHPSTPGFGDVITQLYCATNVLTLFDIHTIQNGQTGLRRGIAGTSLGHNKEVCAGHKSLPPTLAIPCPCGHVLSLA